MLKQILEKIFSPETLNANKGDWGISDFRDSYKKMGYATTITPEIIEISHRRNIDLIVTHHDSWKFMYGQRDETYKMLSNYKIGHIWCHGILDRAPFGTATQLLVAAGCTPTSFNEIAKGEGKIGYLELPKTLQEIIGNINSKINEFPSWIFDNKKSIKSIATVTGAGNMNEYLKESSELGADLYITGEKTLYFCEYASFININTLVFSHNYSEILGVMGLSELIREEFGLDSLTRIDEPHY